jgi:hypothetical protein
VEAENRLKTLEAEKMKLEAMIEEKQKVKRQGLREWERGEGVVGNVELRSSLSEDHLRALSGEGAGGGAY